MINETESPMDIFTLSFKHFTQVSFPLGRVREGFFAARLTRNRIARTLHLWHRRNLPSHKTGTEARPQTTTRFSQAFRIWAWCLFIKREPPFNIATKGQTRKIGPSLYGKWGPTDRLGQKAGLSECHRTASLL